ncbi:hypothetical protein EVAR_24616_1 [Eumeta japonica]|uniref:Uncharacterized protein n=1 Tax=Eumeta variegata TaxID=151549 RepID=A0A4C1V2D2_EUMVA|nr:hypothetical protein EVAR_24616_1 [Eumeta japonica]
MSVMKLKETLAHPSTGHPNVEIFAAVVGDICMSFSGFVNINVKEVDLGKIAVQRAVAVRVADQHASLPKNVVAGNKSARSAQPQRPQLYEVPPAECVFNYLPRDVKNQVGGQIFRNVVS